MLNNEAYSKRLLIFFFMLQFRNDANALLYSLLSSKNDGAQDGDLKVFRFSNICCDWAQCHYHGNGILYDASCKHIKIANFISYQNTQISNSTLINTFVMSQSTYRNSTMP